MASKVSSKNWRFDEIFSRAKLHFVFAESGCDKRVEALDQKGGEQRNYTQFAYLKELL